MRGVWDYVGQVLYALLNAPTYDTKAEEMSTSPGSTLGWGGVVGAGVKASVGVGVRVGVCIGKCVGVGVGAEHIAGSIGRHTWAQKPCVKVMGVCLGERVGPRGRLDDTQVGSWVRVIMWVGPG